VVEFARLLECFEAQALQFGVGAIVLVVLADATHGSEQSHANCRDSMPGLELIPRHAYTYPED
jgi:hypothetical protein